RAGGRAREPMEQTVIEVAGSAKLFAGSPGSGRDRDETVVEPASEASLNVRRQQIDISQGNDRLRATRPASPSRTHRASDQNFQRSHVERVARDEIEDEVVSTSGLSPSAAQ